MEGMAACELLAGKCIGWNSVKPQPSRDQAQDGAPDIYGLAVDGLQVCRGVSFACDLVLWDGGFEFCYFGKVQYDLGRGCVFFEVLSSLCSWDGDQVFALSQHPCEGELSGFNASMVSDGSYSVDEDLILVKGFAGESRVALGPGIFFSKIAGFRD